jgi:replicative DNA helicase
MVENLVGKFNSELTSIDVFKKAGLKPFEFKYGSVNAQAFVSFSKRFDMLSDTEQDQVLRELSKIQPSSAFPDIDAELADEASGHTGIINLKSYPRLCNLTNFMRPGSFNIIAGSPGSCKSTLALCFGRECTIAGEFWRYLPLELSKNFHLRRLAGIVGGTFSTVSGKAEDALIAQKVFSEYRAELVELKPCILDNPLLSGSDTLIDWQNILFMVAELAQNNRIVFIDPMAQIFFGDGFKEYSNQGHFARELEQIAMFFGSTIVLVVHTNKRPEDKLSLSDVEGSKRITQCADTVLMLQAFEPKEFEIFKSGGMRETVTANRCFYIAKARHGSGSNARLAYRFGDFQAPHFNELGVIAPKGK